MTEIAVVLSIVGLIMGAVWASVSHVYDNMRVSDAENGVLETSQAVRAMYAVSGTTGVTTSEITSAGMFPVAWDSNTAGIVGNPWHRNPTKNYAYVFANGSQYAIELDGTSDGGCAALLSYFSANAATVVNGANGGSITGLVGSSGKAAAAFAGTASIGTGGLVTTYASPAICGGGGLNNSVSITFDMTKM